jgi:hypothetical protein
MANEFKVKKGLIVQGSGSTGDTTILDVQGNQGQLFSITDSLEGTLFSVSDISGIPILDVNSNETVKIGTFGNEGIIVNGSNVTSSGNISASGTITANSLVGTVGTATQGTIDIHSLSGYVANEHLDWTADQGSTNIHAGNYTDTNTTYSVGDGGLTQNNFTDADHTKLNGIEASATADQSNAEIRTAVEAATDSNVFTDADHTKLNAIEASADVTDATNVTAAGALMDSELSSITDVKALNQSVISGATPTFTTTNFTDASNKRLMTDAQETKLDSVASSANNYSHPTSAGNKHIPTGGSVGQILKNTASGTATWQTDANTTYSVGDGGLTTNDFTNADHSKLNAIEASATADQSNAEIRTAVEAATDSNVFTDDDHTKLNGIEASATADQTATQIKTLVGTGNGKFVPSSGTSGHFLKHDGSFGIPAYTTNTNTTYSVQDGELSQNNFTNADHTKLNGIEANATADQTTITGNAGTVTNGVYVTGNQSIAGNKTFSGNTVVGVINPTEIAYRATVTSDHNFNGTTLSGDSLGTAQGTSVSQGHLVYLSTAGRWEKTDSDALATSFGMLAIQAGEDQTAQLVVNGLYNLSYDPGGSRGDPLYISGTAGLITSTAPTGTGDIVRIVGYKMHATNGLIYFNPDQTWVELT